VALKEVEEEKEARKYNSTVVPNVTIWNAGYQ
jgi:hypothetical protein